LFLRKCFVAKKKRPTNIDQLSKSNVDIATGESEDKVRNPRWQKTNCIRIKQIRWIESWHSEVIETYLPEQVGIAKPQEKPYLEASKIMGLFWIVQK
jgi:hypothetical protein